MNKSNNINTFSGIESYTFLKLIPISHHKAIVNNLKNKIIELEDYEKNVSDPSLKESHDLNNYQSNLINELESLLVEIQSSGQLSPDINEKITNILKV